VADASLLDVVSAELERRSSLGRLEARGTVRLALKAAGLDAAAVTVQQMAVVLRRVLAGELAARRVADPGALCEALAEHISGLELDPQASQTPEAVFARLAPS
jgi:hypothetical protein